MFRRYRPFPIVNDWNRNYQTIGYGNYGYGIYRQNIDLVRNPFSAGLHLERDIAFIPIANNPFGIYTGYPSIIHQHYPY